MPRLAWITAAVVLFGAAGMMLANRIPPARSAAHWDAYFKLARATRGSSPEDDTVLGTIPQMKRHLEDLLRRDPYNARANVRLAGIYLRLFDTEQQQTENPMPLSQIRDAALASPFRSPEAQDQWLAAVLGNNRVYLDKAIAHAKRGLQLCPLQGEAYVYLAELAFLEGHSPERKHAYVAQSLRVRPHDGLVLFAAGSEAALAGEFQKALELWKRSFHQDPEQQSRIIELLASQMPVDLFLRHFEPDLTGLRKLYSYYRRNGFDREARYLGSRYVIMLEQEAETERGDGGAHLWDQASAVHQFVGDVERAADCARMAVAQAPGDFGKHRNLAAVLIKSGHYDEAIRELQWCLSRQPDDKNLRQMLHMAGRARIEQQGTTLR
jgi:tetratricopeptide (TPR) repeat protein